MARLRQENRRLQAQEATLRLQRDQLQRRLQDAEQQRWGPGGGGVCHGVPNAPPQPPLCVPNVSPPLPRLEATGVAELRTALGDQGDPPEEVSGIWGGVSRFGGGRKMLFALGGGSHHFIGGDRVVLGEVVLGGGDFPYLFGGAEPEFPQGLVGGTPGFGGGARAPRGPPQVLGVLGGPPSPLVPPT